MTGVRRFCTRCGSQLDPGAGYCRVCGILAVNTPPVDIRVAAPRPSPAGGGSLKTALGVGCLFLFLAVAWAFVATLNGVVKYRSSKSEDMENRVVRGLAGRDAAKVADEFFGLVKKKNYTEAYKMLDSEAKGTLDFETFSGMMDGIIEKLGPRKQQELRNAKFRRYTSRGSTAVFYVLTYDTSFDNGSAVEEVTLKKIDGILYVHYYDIKSDMLGPIQPAPPGGGDGGGGREHPWDGQEEKPPQGPTLTI